MATKFGDDIVEKVRKALVIDEDPSKLRKAATLLASFMEDMYCGIHDMYEQPLNAITPENFALVLRHATNPDDIADDEKKRGNDLYEDDRSLYVRITTIIAAIGVRCVGKLEETLEDPGDVVSQICDDLSCHTDMLNSMELAILGDDKDKILSLYEDGELEIDLSFFDRKKDYIERRLADEEAVAPKRAKTE